MAVGNNDTGQQSINVRHGKPQALRTDSTQARERCRRPDHRRDGVGVFERCIRLPRMRRQRCQRHAEQ